MNYYWFNRQEILQKAKEKYSKEKTAEYDKQNKEAIKEKSKQRYKNLSQEEKDKIKEYQQKNIKNWFNINKIIKMSEKRLKFNNIKLNKKEFHKSKEPVDLLSVDLDQIVVSYKFKHNDEGFKYFIGYLKGEIVKPLCIILPQMSGYIKYFENGSKNMSFLIKDDEVWDKYNKIWDLIKDKLGNKFHSEPVYKYKYLKAKLR